MKSKLWSAVPADCKWKTDKILLKGDFTKQKNNKSRVLVLYDSYVLLYKVILPLTPEIRWVAAQVP